MRTLFCIKGSGFFRFSYMDFSSKPVSKPSSSHRWLRIVAPSAHSVSGKSTSGTLGYINNACWRGWKGPEHTKKCLQHFFPIACSSIFFPLSKIKPSTCQAQNRIRREVPAEPGRLTGSGAPLELSIAV